MTAEQYATDLVKVLLAQRPDALEVAELAVERLKAFRARVTCESCGKAFDRCLPQQVYCGSRCRERLKARRRVVLAEERRKLSIPQLVPSETSGPQSHSPVMSAHAACSQELQR